MKNIVLILLLALMGCVNASEHKSDAANTVAGSGSACLSDGKLRDVERLSNAGDMAAITLLIRHLDYCTDEKERARRWKKVAAEAGSEDARKDLVSEMHLFGDKNEKREAEVLAKKWGVPLYQRPKQ